MWSVPVTFSRTVLSPPESDETDDEETPDGPVNAQMDDPNRLLGVDIRPAPTYTK